MIPFDELGGRRGRGRRGRAPVLPTRVPEVIAALARWAVMSSMGAAAACAAAADRDSGPSWEPIRCGEFGERPSLLELTNAIGTLDYVGIFHEPDALRSTGNAWTLDELGVQCGTAEDRAACTAEVEAALVPSAACTEKGECGRFLLTTDGDEVARSDDRTALVSLIEPISDRNEAMLVAMFDGVQIECPSDPLRGTQVRMVDDAFEVRTEWEDCGVGLFRQVVRVRADGSLEDRGTTQIGKSNCVVGRRPEGLCALPAVHRGRSLGAFLAETARLEAASVYAFERLARELAALGAPADLSAAAVRSARDEVRHARTMSALARRWGGTVVAPVVDALPLRGAEAVALENAREGCVRETYGALVAHHQAQRALDPEARAAMQVIAEDETRHAQLSWAIAAWLEPRLSACVQERLLEARRAAVAQLLRETHTGLSPFEAQAIGWPAPELAAAMIERLGSALGLV